MGEKKERKMDETGDRRTGVTQRRNFKVKIGIDVEESEFY